MSGHSKWSTIKRKKGAADAKRGQAWTKLIKEITVAAKMGGGDPDGNARLRRAIDTARSANMPRDNITRAIKKGTGELEGVSYEELLYEGVGPAGTLFLMEALTDNRNRTAADLRKIFDKNNGQLGASGAAAWAFEHKGVIKLAEAATTEESLFELAVGAGAEDIELVEGSWVVTTARTDLDTVSKALQDAELTLEEAALVYVPTTPKEVDDKEANGLMKLFDVLDEHDDVQNVFTDFELSADALAAIE